MASLMNLMKEGFAQDDSPKILLRDAFLEFGTTMTFVFFGTLMAVNAGAVLSVSSDFGVDIARLMPIAFTFGFTVTCLVYATGHLSGGHMNPGVSFMMLLKRKISPMKMVAYWMAQFLGAMVGAALTWGCVSGVKDLGVEKPPFLLGSTTLAPALTTGNGFLLELMGSTFFYFVVAQTALDKRSIAGTSFPPLVIGLSLMIVHLCLISGTGCGVNPARTFGPAMIACMEDSDQCDVVVDDWWWIYWVGPFAGSVLAAELSHWMTVAADMENEGGEEAQGGETGNMKTNPEASDTKDEHVADEVAA